MKQVLLLVIIVGCAAALAAGPAGAAASAPGATIGVVDTERVQAEYKAMQALNQQFMEFQKQQDAQLVRRQKSRMLFEDEQREYLDLSSPTAAPTSDRDKRLGDFEKLSDDRSKRLLDLGQKKDRTADEEQEYQELDVTYKQRTQELNDLRTDVERTVQGKSDELMKLIMDSFNAAVKAVAEDKKLALVLRRSVVYDSTGIPIVLYGGADITEDVITKLNQSPAPQVNLTVPPAPAAAPGTSTPVTAKPAAPAAKPK
jgi:Skp family chaperone for outer membrane proteins